MEMLISFENKQLWKSYIHLQACLLPDIQKQVQWGQLPLRYKQKVACMSQFDLYQQKAGENQSWKQQLM